jgi:hypothetical protein
VNIPTHAAAKVNDPNGTLWLGLERQPDNGALDAVVQVPHVKDLRHVASRTIAIQIFIVMLHCCQLFKSALVATYSLLFGAFSRRRGRGGGIRGRIFNAVATITLLKPGARSVLTREDGQQSNCTGGVEVHKRASLPLLGEKLAEAFVLLLGVLIWGGT